MSYFIHMNPARDRDTGRGFACLAATLVVCAALSSGCGSSADESVSHAEANDYSKNVSKGAPVAPPQVQPQKMDLPQEADPAVILGEMNRQLKRWIVSNQRPPSSLEEFTSTAQIQLPPPPAGKKFVLTKQMRIELADQ